MQLSIIIYRNGTWLICRITGDYEIAMEIVASHLAIDVGLFPVNPGSSHFVEMAIDV